MPTVSFYGEGSLGISWRHRQEDGAAIVKLIREGATAALDAPHAAASCV